MKISFITISFNQADYIEKCIESVSNFSSHFDFEHIIVDGGSTDGTLDKISSKMHDNIILVCEPDKGPADALRKGFVRASGDLLSFVNSDDYFLPDAPNNLKNFLSSKSLDGSCMFCFAGYKEYNGKFKYLLPTSITSERVKCKAAKIFQQGVFFERSLYFHCSGVNVNNKTCWDRELFYDLISAGANITTSFHPIAVFFIHSASISGSGSLSSLNLIEGSAIDENFLLAFSENKINNGYLSICYRIKDYLLRKIYGFIYRKVPR